MQSVVRSFSYADWSLRLGWGFNFVDIFNFNYSKLQCVVPISCVNVLYTVHSDSIIYFHYSGIYFRWKRRENCQITHLLCAVLWYSKSSTSSWSQCDLNPGRVNIFQRLKLYVPLSRRSFILRWNFCYIFKQSFHLSQHGLWCLVSTYTAYTSAF